MTGLTKARLLIVDDEPYIRTLLQRWCERDGHTCQTAETGEIAWDRLQKEEFDLVVLDMRMPGMSGMELLGRIRGCFPALACMMVTAVDDRETAARALGLGALGYVIKPFERNEISINVANVLEQARLKRNQSDYQTHLETAIEANTRALREREEEVLRRLVSATAERDTETGDHIRRIGEFSAVLAERLGWSKEMVDDIRVASMLHDVGKIAISDDLLHKPGKYTAQERLKMQEHTVKGSRILEGSQIPMLQMAEAIARCHHEKWDGSGYPQGLRGTEIPESARIVAIVDVYDAMLSKRIYKDALPEVEVLKFLSEQRGKHFDPKILDAFLEILPELRERWEAGREEHPAGNRVIALNRFRSGHSPLEKSLADSGKVNTNGEAHGNAQVYEQVGSAGPQVF